LHKKLDQKRKRRKTEEGRDDRVKEGEKRRKIGNIKRQGSICVEVGKRNTRWFKYDREYLCVKKSQSVPVIFEPPCMYKIRK
jgi:hypothetical protein